MKYNSIFLYLAGGRSADTVQFSGIDEVKTFGMNVEIFHINFHIETAAGKIEDFRLLVPMVLHHKAMSGHLRLIKSTWKRLSAVYAVFFQIRGWILIHSETSW